MYEAPAPKGTLVNAVGAGDSMVAGFTAGWIEKKDYEHAFYMGFIHQITRMHFLNILQQKKKSWICTKRFQNE